MRSVCVALAGLLSVLCGQDAAAVDWPDLSRPPPAEGGGESDVAVVIGIEDYSYLPDVPGAVSNARDWVSWLRDTRGVPTVKLLTDEEATHNAIRAAAEAAAALAGADGTLWFIFVGHGAPAETGDDGVLVGVSARQNAIDFFPNTLRQQDLTSTLERGAQSHTILVVDACFSGKGGDGVSLLRGLQPALLSGTWEPEHTTVLTAGVSDQFAGPLPGADRPAFSYLLLGALRGWGDRNGDGTITVQEGVDYARRVLFQIVHDRVQTPAVRGPGPDWVLAKPVNGETGPDVSTLGGELGTADPVTPSLEGPEPLDQFKRLMQQQQDRKVLESATQVSGSLPPESASTLAEAVRAIQAEAATAWESSRELREGGGKEALAGVELFLDLYLGASVEMDGENFEVEIPEVQEARQWRWQWLATHGVGGEAIDRLGYSLARVYRPRARHAETSIDSK